MKKIDANKIGKDVEKRYQQRRSDPGYRGVDLNKKAVPFDHSLSLKDSQHETAAKILQECSKLPDSSISTRIESRRNNQILLANLFTNKPPYYTVVGLSPNHWKKTQYSRAGRSIRKLIKAYQKLNYLTMNKGFKNRETGKSRLTRITPTQKLLETCPQLPNAVIYDPVQVVIMKGKKPVIIDENGNEKRGARPLIEYDKQHPVAQKFEKSLIRINGINNEATIRHGNRDVSPFQHAVFTENFQQGGRLYVRGYHHVVNYQQLPDYERAEITINNEPVVELDYSGLHPRLLYAAEGMEYPLHQDPYLKVHKDPSVRKFMKMIFLPMINAEDYTAAEKAANDWLWQFPRRDRNGSTYQTTVSAGKKELQRRLQQIGITAAGPLMKAFMEQHKPISGYLCNGSETGLKLMNKDAKIALDVINYFARNGKPILAVHDSFIVQKRYQKKLRYAMNKSYQQHNHGMKCPIN